MPLGSSGHREKNALNIRIRHTRCFPHARPPITMLSYGRKPSGVTSTLGRHKMADRCPTCYRQMEEDRSDAFEKNNPFQAVFNTRRPLRDTISQTISLFGGIAVGVMIGRGSAETTRTLILGCIGFAVFTIIIQTVSHKWIYRRES